MGGRLSALAAVAALLSLALSGCTEGGSGEPLAQPELRVGQVQGIVHNDAGLPLAGARVSILLTDLFQETGQNGTFRFLDVPVGVHRVRAESNGFSALEQQVNVTEDNLTELMFHLVPLESVGAGYRPHLHDMWGEATELIIMDRSVSMTQPDSTSGIGGPLVYRGQAMAVWPNSNGTSDTFGYRIPVPSESDPPSIVYPGTQEIRIKLTWSTTDATFYKVGLRHRSPLANHVTELPRQTSGSTWTIPVAPNEADTGHQRFTLWNFWVNPYQDATRDGASYRPGLALGNVQVEIRVVRGQVILEPPHEDFWKASTELLLHDHGEENSPCNSAYRALERDTQPCRKTPRRIIPPGTERLTVEMRWTYGQLDGSAPSDLTLMYRTAAQPRYGTRTSQYHIADCTNTGSQIRLCQIKVEPGTSDAYYQRNSLWSFTYGVRGHERSEYDMEPRTLTFTLKVIAYRDTAFAPE